MIQMELPCPGSLALPDGLTLKHQALMRDIADLLWAKYPYHLWMVDVPKGGVVVIRHALLGAQNGYGFVIKLGELQSYDALRDQVIRAGGEMLERANLERGPARPGAIALRVEGLPEKHQPYRVFSWADG